MTILFYLMLLSMPILLLCVLVGILWSVKTSQYDDIENAADKILFD